MQIIVVYDPDEDCVDPSDEHAVPRRHSEVIVTDADAILMWREYRDDFDGGFRTHVLGSGIFENVTPKHAKRAVKRLLTL